MKRVLMAGLATALIGGCGNKKKSEGGGTGGATAPAAFKAWTPAGAAKAWEGAWSSRLTLKMGGVTSMAGDPAALEIKGDQATAFDGAKEHQLGFEIAAPCVARFSQPLTEGNLKGGTAYHEMRFLLEGDKLLVGSGAAGYRKGKAAVVCSEGMKGGVHILDDQGACATWDKKFGDWERTPTTCTWSQQDGNDVLTIGTGDWAPVVVARGDLLESDQFRQFVREGYHQPAADYAAAKAAVSAQLKADDPGEKAKAAGGKVGETDTVVSLQASYGADKSLKGKPLEITARYLNSNSATGGGQTTHNVILVDSKEQYQASKLTLTCHTREAVTGLTQYDRVIAKGTIDEGFGTAELRDCTVTKAAADAGSAAP